MPFKSKAQIAKFAELVKKGKMKQSTFDEFMKSTPAPQNLPKKLGPERTSPVDPKRKGGRYGH